MFPALFWQSAVQQFFSPAQQAMVPRLVPDGQLFVANALNGQIGDVSLLAGSALGGVIAPFVEHTLHGTSGEFGLVAAAQAAGGIAGGLFAAAVGQRISAYRLLSLGAVAFGLADLAIFLYPLVYGEGGRSRPLSPRDAPSGRRSRWPPRSPGRRPRGSAPPAAGRRGLTRSPPR